MIYTLNGLTNHPDPTTSDRGIDVPASVRPTSPRLPQGNLIVRIFCLYYLPYLTSINQFSNNQQELLLHELIAG
jgi:hypothetical protein